MERFLANPNKVDAMHQKISIGTQTSFFQRKDLLKVEDTQAISSSRLPNQFFGFRCRVTAG
jgi:hypothetical protein